MSTKPKKEKAARVNPAKGIYKRGGVYWLNFQRNGQRHFISLDTPDLYEAIAKAQEFRGAPALAARSALAADIDAFLAHKTGLNVFSRATARVHGDALRHFECHVPGLKTCDIRTAHAAAHYGRLRARVAETTAQIHIRALRSFYAWAVETRRAQVNPFLGFKLATIDKLARLKFATQAERDALIANAPDDDLRFILFAGFHAGMRKNEIIEARVGWFDLSEDGTVHIENTDTFRIKDRDARFVPLTEQFRAFLIGYLAGKPADAFALRPEVRHGKGTYRYDFHRPFNDYLTARGMREKITAHVMRHTFASLLVQNNVSIFKVARWLGDGVEVVEKHYAHLAPKDRDIEKMMAPASSPKGSKSRSHRPRKSHRDTAPAGAAATT